MNIIDFWGKGWKYPVTVTNGAVAYAEGEDAIRDSILIILGTAKGERVMRPNFGCGINELVFAPNDTATAALIAFYAKEALQEWEPRIDVLDVEVVPDDTEGNRLNIGINYQVKQTNTKKNLVYPFYLEGTT
jgi:phage baseplate assembly protein W